MARDRLIFIISFAFLGIAAAFLFSKKKETHEKPTEVVAKIEQVAEPAYILPIEEGKIAVPLLLNLRSAVVEFLKIGDIVDVIFTSKSDSSFETVSLTLLDNVRVIGIGKDSIGKPFNDKTRFYKSNVNTEILLEMTPRQSEILSYAELNGTVTIGIENSQSPTHPRDDALANELINSTSDVNFNSILISHTLKKLFPTSNIKIISTPSGYIVSGDTSDKDTSDKIVKVLEMLSNDDKSPPVNLLETKFVAAMDADPPPISPIRDLASYSLRPGKRAVLLESNPRLPITINLHPSSIVDIKFISKSDIGFSPVSLKLLQNIKVLAIGRNIVGKRIDIMAHDADMPVQYILEMTPREAEIFHFAMESGIVTMENSSSSGMCETDCLLESLFESDSVEKFQSILITYTLNSLFPLVNIKVTSTLKGYIVEGKVPDPQMAIKIMEIITKLVPRGDRAVINLMDVEPQLVLIKVRVYEVKKDFISRVGLNWEILFQNCNQSLALGAVYPRPPLTDPNYFLSAMGVFGNYNLSALIDMLEEDGLNKIIAEPNLTTVSGETAHFFAGGEYPIPVPQGGNLLGAVTIEYKKYGVILDFTPIVDLNGLITMHIIPEVSNLDYSNAVVLQGFRIPGLLTRRVNTKVKLWSGQSYIIGGLLLSTPLNKNTSLYGLNKIPILGAIFNSNRFEQHVTELMVIVTPILINENRLNSYQGRLALDPPVFNCSSENNSAECDGPELDRPDCGYEVSNYACEYGAGSFGECEYEVRDSFSDSPIDEYVVSECEINPYGFIETPWAEPECSFRN